MVMHELHSLRSIYIKFALRKELNHAGFLFLEVSPRPCSRNKTRRFILNGMGAGYLRPVIDHCFN